MFFSYQLLVRKNSSFAVIWRYMHDRSSRMKVTKKELLSVDINQACDDLSNYVPTGILAREELFNKMSLYLLAQLSYGVTLVLRVHAEYLIADLESFLKSLQRFPVEELVADGEIVKTPGHRKKRKVGDVALEELEQLAVKGVPAGEEDEEFEESRKKRRKSRITKPSLLNLNDPSAYVDHQVPGSAPRVQPIEDLNQLDDMFMDQSDIRLPPWPPLEGEEFPPTQHVPEEVARDVQPKQPKLSRATILSVGEESFMHELEMAIAGTPEEQQEEQQQGPQPIKEIAIPEEENPEPPIEHVREPIYRQNASMLEEDNIMLQQSLSLDHDIIRLEALPDVQQVPQRGPQRKVRRPKHLIVDEKMELTNEEMARNLADYSDTLRNREKFIEELRQTEREKMPTLKELLNPRPLFLPGISEELYPLFDTVLKEVYERPLTYEEGIRMTDDEMRVRRLPVDVATLSLRTTPTKDRTVDESIIQLQEISQLVPPTPTMEKAPKISVADFNPFVDDGQGEFEQPPPQQQEEQEQPPLRPSTPLEPEKTRHARETMQTLSSRATDLQPPLMEESYVQPMMELSLDAGDFIEDIQLQRESILVKPSPDEPEEGWLDEEMDQLYDAIVAEHNETQKPKLFYDDIVEKQEMKMSKKQAARKFYTLLKLLKHRKVKAQQRKGGYTPIEVRVPGIIAAEEKKKHRES